MVTDTLVYHCTLTRIVCLISVELFASSAPTRSVTREEPEKIKKWREEQKKRLEEKGKMYGLKENLCCSLVPCAVTAPETLPSIVS